MDRDVGEEGRRPIPDGEAEREREQHGELLDAIRRVAGGGSTLDPEVVAGLDPEVCWPWSRT